MAESADHRRGAGIPVRSARLPTPRREVAAIPSEPWCSLIPAPRAVPTLERMQG